MSRTIVASPSAVSATSTAVDCSPTSNSRASHPHVKTIRHGKSTCTYSPIIFDPLISNRQTPPGRGSSVASLPIQRTSFDGSVKYSNTTSGAASTRTSCSIRSVAAGVSATLVLLDDLLQAPQPAGQHLGEEAMQVAQSLGANAVQTPRAVTPLVHEACVLQHLQVLGDGGLRDGEVARDVAGGALTGCQQPQDLASFRLGDCLEDLHGGPRSLAATNISASYSFSPPPPGRASPRAPPPPRIPPRRRPRPGPRAGPRSPRGRPSPSPPRSRTSRARTRRRSGRSAPPGDRPSPKTDAPPRTRVRASTARRAGRLCSRRAAPPCRPAGSLAGATCSES